MFAKRDRLSFSICILILAMLACNLPVNAPAVQNPTVDTTKVALEIQATQNAAANPTADTTKVALEMQATQNAAPPVVDATKVALEVQATSLSSQLTQQANQPAPPTDEPPTAIPPTAILPTTPPDAPTPDFDARLKTARILVYEDTPGLGLWISDALDGLGLKYTHVGDAIGHLMENLNSSIKWDLIIIGAEAKTKVQGEFWDVIGEKVAREKTALIAEVWYLDLLGGGRIKTLMANCGIEYQRDWPLAESIYWLDSSHPLFGDPNETSALINYSRYWQAQAGDLIRLAPGSKATLLAGTFQKRKSDYGVLATCMEGRMVFQTFSNHDFHQDAIIRLWQNYITYTLKNRFSVVP
jgi:hypothetical protein